MQLSTYKVPHQKRPLKPCLLSSPVTHAQYSEYRPVLKSYALRCDPFVSNIVTADILHYLEGIHRNVGPRVDAHGNNVRRTTDSRVQSCQRHRVAGVQQSPPRGSTVDCHPLSAEPANVNSKSRNVTLTERHAGLSSENN